MIIAALTAKIVMRAAASVVPVSWAIKKIMIDELSEYSVHLK